MPYLEPDALAITRAFDRLPEEAKRLASAWMQGYEDQQKALGQPLFPQTELQQRQHLRAVLADPQKLDETNGLFSLMTDPARADAARKKEAGVLFLASRYGEPMEEIRLQRDRYALDYSNQKWGISKMMDPTAFYDAAKAEVEQEIQKEGFYQEATSAAVQAAMAGRPMLDALSEWQGLAQGPQQRDKLEMTPAFMAQYRQTAEQMRPHHELVQQTLEATQRRMQGQSQTSDAAFLEEVGDLLLDLPEPELRLVMQSMKLGAEQRGLIVRAQKGAGYGRGAQQMLRGLFMMPFEGLSESREGELFWQQLGESVFRFGKAALVDRERIETQIENVPEAGVVKFNGQAIRTVEDARKYVDEQITHAMTTEASMAMTDHPETVLMMQMLMDKRNDVTLDAEATRLIQEAKAREMKSLRLEFELDHLGEIADPVPNVYASTLGTSGTALVLTAATRGLAIPAMTVAYKNTVFAELSLKYPQMSLRDRSQIAWLSGGIKALGDRVGVNAFTKLPALKNLLTKPLTGQLIARSLGRAGLTYGVENGVEAGQDLTTPLLMQALKSDVPGFDWEAELKNFYQSRLDVAVGMIPLTLLGIGAASVRDMQGMQEMLSQNDFLGSTGTIEADRMIIIDRAQKGDLEGAQAALQEAWQRRDPAVAAEYQDRLARQEAHGQQALAEATRLGLMPRVLAQEGGYTVQNSAGAQARFKTLGEAYQAAWESMTETQREIVTGMLEAPGSSAPQVTTTTTFENVPAGSTLNYDAEGNLIGFTPPGQKADARTNTDSERLVFSQPNNDEVSQEGSADSEVVSVHRSIAESQEAFQLGKSKPDTQGYAKENDWRDSLEDLAKAYSVVESPLNVGEDYPSHPDGYAFNLHTKKGSAFVVIDPAMGTVHINSAGLDSNQEKFGGGSQVYQMVQTFAKNNGLTFKPDHTVSPIAQKRRISQMASSALRHGSTAHLDGLATYTDGETGEIKTEVPGWKPGDNDHNLALLLKMEHAYVMQEAQARGIDLGHLTHDPATHNIIDGHTGTSITEGTLRSLVDRFKSADSGVGETTLLRALVTGSALQRGQSDRGVHHLQKDAGGMPRRTEAGRLGGELVSVARGLYYSRAPEGAGGLPPRRVGDTVSARPGGLATVLTETTRHLNEQQPGLLNERTHLFTTAEALLDSDYARQHPFTPEEIAGIRRAEGFYDRDTGHSFVIAENTALRPGETVVQALSRVLLHERVAHDGLNILLGRKDSPQARRWAALTAKIPETELTAIAQEEGYKHLAGNREALAFEWFARRTEKNPALLKKDSLARQMWDTFRQIVANAMTRLGIPVQEAFETQVADFQRQARKAALRGPGTTAQRAPSNGPTGLQFSQRGDADPGSGLTIDKTHPGLQFDLSQAEAQNQLTFHALRALTASTSSQSSSELLLRTRGTNAPDSRSFDAERPQSARGAVETFSRESAENRGLGGRRGRETGRRSEAGSGRAESGAETLHELRILAEWARRGGGSLFDRSRLSRLREEGGEHTVHDSQENPQRLFKVTHPGTAGLSLQAVPGREGPMVMQEKGRLEDYLKRLILTNIVFKDDLRFEGVIPGALPSIVISQPVLNGPHPLPRDINAFLGQLGFERVDTRMWYRSSDGLALGDTSPNNFVILDDGRGIVPIDISIRFATPEMTEAWGYPPPPASTLRDWLETLLRGSR
ncbi:hypothetical protein SAMN02745166_05008 [Prosthecobacter debontii]|uniref:Large polyvalent protein associated domain-containing protein n=1 Tax=Prosthecobacter debontii TaxID=48467 RepID=A0A1T4Z3Z3_9BACT|nr:hypothetical protein [Prosthecobacter debontii]SKB08724.1 hypothetical protein SAMN02745166_05008 [Prosthecobacter debontii]